MDKQLAKSLAVRAVKLGLKKLFLLLLPYLIPALVVLAGLVFLSVLVAATYSAMCPGGYMKSHEESPEDAAIKQKYIELTDTVWKGRPAWNAADCYLVPGEGRYHPPSWKFTPLRLGGLVDHYRQDYELRLKWGMVHAANLFWAYSYGKDEIPEEQREKVAADLHPYFYYKPSYITVTTCCETEEGTECSTVTEHIYLLVEAYTIYGHYLFDYEWRTETFTSGKCTTTVTKEVLKSRQQILPDKYQWIKKYLRDLCDLRDDPQEIETARAWVMEAGEGFTEGREWLEWMLSSHGISEFASAAMIPPELIPLLKDVADKHGVPWWFLAAVAMVESTFDPGAVNSQTGCFGLMQVSETNWAAYAPELGFDPVLDRENPRAQLEVGAYMLERLLGNVDWDGSWQEQTLRGLAFYGGFRNNGKVDEKAVEACREQYASKVWAYAESFRSAPSVWPAPGYMSVSSFFGFRVDPFTGEVTFHEGIDIPAPEGASVVSVSGGQVTAVGYEGGYGLRVTVRDGLHLYLYAHLSEANVSVGQVVSPGDLLGSVGSTGRSTDPHLHFGVKDLFDGCWVDPLGMLSGN